MNKPIETEVSEDPPKDTWMKHEQSQPATGEAKSEPEDGEMVSDSIIGQEDSVGFMAEEAAIDDIPTATTMTAIVVHPVAEKPSITSSMAETGAGNQDGSDVSIVYTSGPTEVKPEEPVAYTVSTNINLNERAKLRFWQRLAGNQPSPPFLGYAAPSLQVQYYTSNAYSPVQDVTDSCRTEAVTNVIFGLIIPIFAIVVSIFVSFTFATMYGVAVAGIGMLNAIATGLAIDAYGPISDNAGGIAEMAGMSHIIRERTDALDAAENTTTAIGKVVYYLE
ncbi:vacuolar H+-pyrophosphatase [Artemisia annua]|uniref:H(+)-exporting diphosphatase n=1 Tax=Artemisia annua TaxID=35608 RepID=A0A2U1LQH4_ARTAN|nr:vacuolar H+-pyrophosphatase [Artemisia annua]